MIATAVATTDTSRAVALVEKVGGPAFYHELARTRSPTRSAPSILTAIKIIEGMKQ